MIFLAYFLKVTRARAHARTRARTHPFLLPGHCSTRQQRSIHCLSGIQRLRMILYADEIVLLCNDIDELSEIVKIYGATFTRFGLKFQQTKPKPWFLMSMKKLKLSHRLFLLVKSN